MREDQHELIGVGGAVKARIDRLAAIDAVVGRRNTKPNPPIPTAFYHVGFERLADFTLGQLKEANGLINDVLTGEGGWQCKVHGRKYFD